MGRPRTKSDQAAGFIAFGSPEHEFLLGMDGTNPPERRAELEEAFAAVPTPQADPSRKKPINKRNYAKGERIIDGWKRR